MNLVKVLAIVLIVVGVAALAYGGFTYTKETHDLKLGPIDLSMKDKETVNIPVWAGVGAIPTWPHSRGWGYAPSSLLGVVVVVLLVLLLLGRL